MTTRLLLCLLFAAGSAQVYERALNEQDLQRLLPVLRAEAAAADERAQEAKARDVLHAKRATAMRQAAAEIARGADPLAWLRARSRDVAAPSTATYHSTCSHALTASDGRPSAVLSFGIAAPSGWLYVWRERDAAAIVPPPGAPTSGQGTAQATSARAQSIVQQTRTYYSSRGFEYVGERAPFEWQFLAPDKHVSATIMGVNVLGRVEPCRTLANGPAILVQAADELFEKAPEPPPDAGRAAEQAFHAALDKAGLSETEYLNRKLQLLAARRDAGDEDAGREVGSRDASESAVRRQNARFYREHRAALDTLLDRLSQADAVR